MNLFQAANGAATFLILGAVAFGTANAIKNNDVSIFTLIMNFPATAILILFVVLFKIKTAFDDHKHFGEPYQFATNLRYIGFILAIFSWFFWALAGYFVGQPLRSAELIGISIIIASLWLVVHLIEIWSEGGRPLTEDIITVLREKWLLINLLYLLCIVTYVGWLSPVVQEGNWVVLVVMLVILIFDMLTSRSFRDMT